MTSIRYIIIASMNIKIVYTLPSLLLIGMLSKSLGQVLRVSVAMHVLPQISTDEEDLPGVFSDGVIEAAINFVETCSVSITHTSVVMEISQKSCQKLVKNRTVLVL